MVSFTSIQKNVIAYITYVSNMLKKTRRDFPTHKELTESPDATMEILGLFLGDLNKLSHLNQDISIRKISLRLLEFEALKEIGMNRMRMDAKEVAFYMNQISELQHAVLEAKRSVELQIEAIRSIQSAKKTYDRLTGAQVKK